LSRRDNILAFDDFVVGNSAVYTRARLNSQLGGCDKCALTAVADQVSGTTPTITVQIEESADERNWSSKNGTPEINAQSLSASQTNMFTGADAGTSPAKAFVRLRVALASAGAPPQAHLRIYACLRDDS